MRVFKYAAHRIGEATIIVTDEDIKNYYFPHWSTQMTKLGKMDQISLESCIEDWMIAHWAIEIKND